MVNGLKRAKHRHGPFEVWCYSTVGWALPHHLLSTSPQSDLKHYHECVWVTAYAYVCLCVCERERDYTSLLYIFYVLLLVARCQLPTHTLSLQPEPVSVFITSSLWTVKNRKCLSSSFHLHAHTHTHYLCHSLPLSASLCLFHPSLMASHILSLGTKKGLRNL